MFIFKNRTELYADGITISIPAGCKVADAEDGEMYTGDCVSAFSPNEDYKFHWQTFEQYEEGTTKEALENLVEDMGKDVAIHPIEINGLKGHYTVYNTKREGNYELRLDVGNGKQLCFYILSYRRNGAEIENILQSNLFHEALNGIYAE